MRSSLSESAFYMFVAICYCVSVCFYYFVFLLYLLPSSFLVFFFLMIRRPPRSTLDRSSAASDVYKRQVVDRAALAPGGVDDTGELARGVDGLEVGLHEGQPQLLGGAIGDVEGDAGEEHHVACLLYTSPSPRDRTRSRMPSSA